MATKRLVIDGYGQIELNNCAFRRDGRIEAQLPLNSATFSNTVPCENGMILAINSVGKKIDKPAIDKANPSATMLGLVYTSEHMYDERKNGLKDFCTYPTDDFYPRLGYLAVGDKFTENCISYSLTDYATEALFITALKACATTKLYCYPTADGSTQIRSATTAGDIPYGTVIAATTMPDGQLGVKIQVTNCAPTFATVA